MRNNSSSVSRSFVAKIPFVVHHLVTAKWGSPCIPAISVALHCIPMTRMGRATGQLNTRPRLLRWRRFALLDRTGHNPSRFSLSAFSTTLPSHRHRIRFPCSLSFFTSSSAFESRERSMSPTVHFTDRNSFPTRLVPAPTLQDYPPYPSPYPPNYLRHMPRAS